MWLAPPPEAKRIFDARYITKDMFMNALGLKEKRERTSNVIVADVEQNHGSEILSDGDNNSFDGDIPGSEVQSNEAEQKKDYESDKGGDVDNICNM